VAARSGGQAEANAQRINAAGGKAFALQCDVSDYAACHIWCMKPRNDLARRMCGCNNAGVIEPISTWRPASTRMGSQFEITLIGA